MHSTRTAKHRGLRRGHMVLGLLALMLMALGAAFSGIGSNGSLTVQDVASSSQPAQSCQGKTADAGRVFVRSNAFERLNSTTLVLPVAQPTNTVYADGDDDAVVYYGQLTCVFEVGIASPHHLGAFTVADMVQHRLTFVPYTAQRSITNQVRYLLGFYPMAEAPKQLDDECVTQTPPTLALVKPDMVTVVTLQDCQWLAPLGSHAPHRSLNVSALALAG